MSTPIEGRLVESDIAGTGPAVNAETGEVTQPGEPLPPIVQEGGTPLPERVEAYVVMWECLCSDVALKATDLGLVCPGHGRKRISKPERIENALPQYVGVHLCSEHGLQCPKAVQS